MSAISQAAYQILEANLDKLPAKDRDFAASLVKNAKKYNGSVTPKQAYWIAKMIDRATNPNQQVVVKGDVGDFSKVYALFQKAQATLKFPKIRLQLPSKAPVVLAVAGPKSKAPGIVNISDGGPWGANKWYGRVEKDGTWTPGGDHPELGEVAALLKKLADSPEDTAAEYGKLTGYCCFCGRSLTDENSTAVGYGETCAKNYGLLANYKNANPTLKAAAAKAAKTNGSKFITDLIDGAKSVAA